MQAYAVGLSWVLVAPYMTGCGPYYILAIPAEVCSHKGPCVACAYALWVSPAKAVVKFLVVKLLLVQLPTGVTCAVVLAVTWCVQLWQWCKCPSLRVVVTFKHPVGRGDAPGHMLGVLSRWQPPDLPVARVSVIAAVFGADFRV